MPFNVEQQKVKVDEQYDEALKAMSLLNNFWHEARQDRRAYFEWYDIAVRRKRQLDLARKTLRDIGRVASNVDEMGGPKRIARMAADTLEALCL